MQLHVCVRDQKPRKMWTQQQNHKQWTLRVTWNFAVSWRCVCVAGSDWLRAGGVTCPAPSNSCCHICTITNYEQICAGCFSLLETMRSSRFWSEQNQKVDWPDPISNFVHETPFMTEEECKQVSMPLPSIESSFNTKESSLFACTCALHSCLEHENTLCTHAVCSGFQPQLLEVHAPQHEARLLVLKTSCADS